VAGRVVILNGTSSAGKSTVVQAFRDLMVNECWVATGLDAFLAMFPGAWFTSPANPGAHGAAGFAFLPDGRGALIATSGPDAERLLSGYRRSVAALAHAGNDVIVDEVMVGCNAWADWDDALTGVDALWVRVECPLEVCIQRERDRGDRLIGLALGQHERIHNGVRYNLVIDTAERSPEENARIIADRIGLVQPRPESHASTG
jgi:chloramphenicol 3-O phosphotransferase